MSDRDYRWGLAAFGRHGCIEAHLNEPIDHDGPWQLQISGKDWEVIFEVVGPSTARELAAFVMKHADGNEFAEYRVGSFRASDVLVVKDSEFAYRFWLRLRGGIHQVEITIQAKDAVSFGKALKSLVADLAL